MESQDLQGTKMFLTNIQSFLIHFLHITLNLPLSYCSNASRLIIIHYRFSKHIHRTLFTNYNEDIKSV